jgi:hypothetical protein
VNVGRVNSLTKPSYTCLTLGMLTKSLSLLTLLACVYPPAFCRHVGHRHLDGQPATTSLFDDFCTVDRREVVVPLAAPARL